MLVTATLTVALALQIRFCGRHIDPSVSVPQQKTATKLISSDLGRLTGTWEMKVEKRKGGVQNWTLTLTQDGEVLSGVITSEGGDLPVTGTIKGDEVRLSATRLGLTVEFPAKIEGEGMVGTMKALMIRRRWTAKRKQVAKDAS